MIIGIGGSNWQHVLLIHLSWVNLCNEHLINETAFLLLSFVESPACLLKHADVEWVPHQHPIHVSDRGARRHCFKEQSCVQIPVLLLRHHHIPPSSGSRSSSIKAPPGRHSISSGGRHQLRYLLREVFEDGYLAVRRFLLLLVLVLLVVTRH